MRKAIQYNLGAEFATDTAEGQAGIRSSFHFHNLYEIYFLEWGDREYLIDGMLYTVDENTVILVPPGTFHETTGGRYRRRLFQFSRGFLSRYLSKSYTEELLSAFSSKSVRILPHEKQELLSLSAQAEVFFQNDDGEGFALKLARLLSIVKAANNRQMNELQKEGRLIDRITDYVEQHAFEKIELQQIADEFFINKYYLCHLFRTEKRMSLFDFLTKIRIERASYLLATTKKKIKEISAECGFNSEYYFSKRFRAVTGLSPREYQQQCAVKK